MNRLSDSSSLYLRQHADNPVHWRPWNDEALAEARDSGRPILLSIGYSACHWCHVMAHESFEDPATAEVMNELFVNIKVDREERPDLDKVYQLAHQLLTGRGGGWPLTVFIEPRQLAPFFAGTYFPPEPRHGMPPFTEVLRRVREWYDGKPEEVRGIQENLERAIGAIQQGGEPGEAPAESLLEGSLARARDFADRVNGGFGGAPKFPQAPLLAALPVLARRADGSELRAHLDFTLAQMACGGLRDQLDGGFFRYTVDGDWTIPHFEKMLYDNALLLPLYAEAAARGDDAWMGAAAAGIVNWLQADMRQDNGGYSSSMDADADGHEGGYHVWRRQEVAECLEADELAAAVAAFGLDGPANFEGEAWHFTRRNAAGGEAGIAQEALGRAVEKLLARRSRRVPPATDHKQLTAWNALCIEGLARAGLALEREDWVDAAADCMDFIRREHWQDGGLLAVSPAQEAAIPAYLDDHAFLLSASLALLAARWDPGLLEFATTLADGLLERFADPEHGGFFFTAEGVEAPLHRLRVLQDDATPSGNGVAARALQRLGHLRAEAPYLEAAARLLKGAVRELEKYPLGHASLLVALDEYLDPPAQVIIAGGDAAERKKWKKLAQSVDRVHCYSLDGDGWPEILGPRTDLADTTAFVCLGQRCLPAIDRLQDLEQQLQSMD